MTTSPIPEAPITSRHPMTFRAWLAQQRHRADPVGDLARDLLTDRYQPTTPAALVTHLDRAAACAGAIRAAALAGSEWEATR